MKHSLDYSSRFRILKGGKISLVVSALIASMSLLQAAPSGGVVTAGSASIAQNGSVTNITQTTNKAAINWQNFSIAQSETVNFKQPNASSVTLNRVVGNEKSVIDGALNANGQVFILNSNGVLFSKNASINTAGLVATTMNLSDADFMNGNYAFKGDSQASIINQGTINISDKGYAALFGKEVKNEGFIKATLGKVELVGAKEVTLNLNGNSLVNLKVDKGVLDALVENKGAIYADGGEVYLTTNAVGELLKGVVNNTGIIEANSIDDITGKIELFAHGGTGEFGGTLSTGKGEGFIETSGKEFVNHTDLHVETGAWLIDPVNITIDTALAGTISTALGSGGVTITTNGACTGVTCNGTGTNGDIFVNSGITWASGNALTLHADRNIEINAAINASSGSGGRLVLEYGQGAVASANTAYYLVNAPISLQARGAANGNNGANPTNFSTKLGSNGTAVNYTTITNNTGTALNTKLSGNLGGNFALSTDIALSGTNNWTPVGTFSGRFEGLGHTIDGLNIVGTDISVGLFSEISNTYIGNIHLSNATVEGNNFVGALVGSGFSSSSLIVNASSSGSIVGVDSIDKASNIGGLVGGNVGKIIFSHSSAEVGLKTGSIGDIDFGGLVGVSNGAIENSYATGKVSGNEQVGGLVGNFNSSGTLKNSYATGEVLGASWVGGLLGVLVGGTTENSYATGKVTGTARVGGLAGQNQGTINHSYATGLVAGTTNVGGFVGYNTASGGITNSFWDKDTSGQPTNGVGTSSTGTFTTLSGKTTAQMMDSSTYTVANGWLTTIWSHPTAARGATVEGYEAGGGLPYLTGVTRAQDIVTHYETLFQGGMGINGNPYTITNWTQLQNINYASDHTLLSKYYTLSNSINNATADYTTIASSTANSGAGFVPIGTQFKGTFDGLGHTIADLYINRPNMSTVGLFSFAYGATIRNIGLVNANITGKNITGGLVGYAAHLTTITNAYATGSVTGTDMVGGLVGAIDDSTITNSYATAGVIGSGNQVGGLLGAAYKESLITNSYATGSVKGATSVGGLVGELLSTSSIANSYATGLVTGTTFAGGLLGSFSSTGAVTNSYWDTKTSNQPTSAGGVGAVGKTTEDMMKSSTYAGWLTTIWSFPTAARGATVAGYEAGGGLPYLTSVTRAQDIVTHYETLFQGGMGINGNPYTITNWTQLQNINNSNILNANYYFNLSNDISSATAGYTALASATANTNKGWTPIGNNTTHFKGHFNGQGHTIDGLVINLPSSGFRGFFGVAGSGSTIQNIGLTNIDIHGNIYTGGLVGYNAGGSISNAYTTGTVIGQDSVGGLVGDNYSGSISNAYASGSVTGRNSVGGLVGLIEAGSISNAYASGSVTGTGTNIGGLVGSKPYGTISNSFWNTQTSGQPTVGVGSGSSTGVTGKTTAELKLFSTFSNAVWNITGTDGVYPTLTFGTGANAAYTWQMIHPLTPTPTSTPTQTTNPDVTAIVNGTAITPPVLPNFVPPTPNNQTQTPDVTAIVNGTAITPPVLPNFVPPTPPVHAPQQFSFGGQMVQLVSTPSTDVASQLVGTQEARAMMQGADVGDLRIPLGQNSQIQLVNGGVNLPTGVDQEYFMAQR